MYRTLLCLMLLTLVARLAVPGQALAHDDPIVTVRVLSDGFNVLDMNQVLGEISDSATLTVDRTVQGRQQIQAWVKEQMDDDLRIQIVDIGTPQRLPDGYTLNWTARFSRQDWRQAGVASREASNMVVIQNGRITQWSASLDSGTSAASANRAVAATPIQPAASGAPEVFGIPLTLLVAGGMALLGATLLVRGVVRR